MKQSGLLVPTLKQVKAWGIPQTLEDHLNLMTDEELYDYERE